MGGPGRLPAVLSVQQLLCVLLGVPVRFPPRNRRPQTPDQESLTCSCGPGRGPGRPRRPSSPRGAAAGGRARPAGAAAVPGTCGFHLCSLGGPAGGCAGRTWPQSRRRDPASRSSGDGAPGKCPAQCPVAPGAAPTALQTPRGDGFCKSPKQALLSVPARLSTPRVVRPNNAVRGRGGRARHLRTSAKQASKHTNTRELGVQTSSEERPFPPSTGNLSANAKGQICQEVKEA